METPGAIPILGNAGLTDGIEATTGQNRSYGLGAGFSRIIAAPAWSSIASKPSVTSCKKIRETNPSPGPNPLKPQPLLPLSSRNEPIRTRRRTPLHSPTPIAARARSLYNCYQLLVLALGG